MASAFNTSVTALEDELMQLILDGQINARIDSHNKVRESKLNLLYACLKLCLDGIAMQATSGLLA